MGALAPRSAAIAEPESAATVVIANARRATAANDRLYMAYIPYRDSFCYRPTMTPIRSRPNGPSAVRSRASRVPKPASPRALPQCNRMRHRGVELVDVSSPSQRLMTMVATPCRRGWSAPGTLAHEFVDTEQDGERLDRDVRGAAIVEVVAIPHALSACAKN